MNGVILPIFVKNRVRLNKIDANILQLEKSAYLCNAFEEKSSVKKHWRDGRVVDCGGLENRCTARYRGFESLSLRQDTKVKPAKTAGFLVLMRF